ncbi:hypothetical protein GTS_06170 [Gandjariella thermophila]|uniref:DNA-binding protein n=2 Tax=Gandjariella thermophila TaxID=1931992 RepID=A0A4D4J0T9_9PSEU|nr:hypothetical protein GTS_06170 [Gandjariella thermophila]
MVNNWVEAIGDRNPVYTDPEFAETSVHGGIVAPPAMAQVWTMGGLHPQRAPDDPLHGMMAELDAAGFTSVVATNSEQTYHRYLRPGEHVSVTTRLESVVGPKRTRLGEGWFVTTRSTWYVGDEAVTEMLFRVLKFRPSTASTVSTSASAGESASAVSTSASAGGSTSEASTLDNPAPPRAAVIKPVRSRDTAFFWDGTAAGELRIQRCGACGRLRHPPGPMCPACGSTSPEYLVAAGRGEVYSYVVHHHPPMPGRETPFVVALVELPEGVRVLGELLDVPPDDVRVGMPVEVTFLPVDDDITLPAWRPVREGS